MSGSESWEIALEGNVDACKAATPERAAAHRWSEPPQLFQTFGFNGRRSCAIQRPTCGGSAVNRG